MPPFVAINPPTAGCEGRSVDGIMSESFAELLEESFANQKIKTGVDPHRHGRRRQRRHGDRQRRAQVRGGHPSRSVFQRARRARSPSRRPGRSGARYRRGRLRRDALVARESQAHAHLDASRGVLPEGRDRHGHRSAAASAAASRSTSTSCARSCRARSSTCGRSAIRRHSKGQHARVQGHQARSEAQQRRRVAARGRRGGVQRRARVAAEEPPGRHGAQGRRQESHRLRRVRRLGRHRRLAAHHRHGVETRQASVRGRQRRPGARSQGARSSIASATASRSA